MESFLLRLAVAVIPLILLVTFAAGMARHTASVAPADIDQRPVPPLPASACGDAVNGLFAAGGK